MKTTGLAILLALAAALTAGASGAQEPDFTATGINTVRVSCGGLDVAVIGEDTETVSVRADFPSDTFFDSRDWEIVHEVKGSTLRIQVEKQRLFASADQGKVTLIVPRDVNLRVESASGNVSLQGLERTDTSVRTASGEIHVRDVRGELAVSTASGRITLDGAEGRVDASTASGRIRGDGVRLTGDSTFNTISGDITVSLDTPLDSLRFDLSTFSGVLRVGSIRTRRGLQMGFGDVSVTGSTISGSMRFE